VISVTMNHQKAISGEQRTNTTQQMGRRLRITPVYLWFEALVIADLDPEVI